MVPPFSVQTKQKNTEIKGLPRTRSQSLEPRTSNDYKLFKSYYDNGILPIRISYRDKMDSVWTEDPAAMSADQLAQMIKKIVIGLPLVEQPYRMLAHNSFNYLLSMSVDAEILLDVISDIVSAFRKGLECPDNSKKEETIQLIIKFCKIPPCAYALVSYYRHLLPPLRKLKYGGFNGYLTPTSTKLDQAIDALLHTLEETGGPDAYINIKYILPAYQSHVNF
ncbi:hypothetical protein L596_006602 [Steinernema carpocapsae]|uniref:Uncharacterized protein n=1 Tax=Steinernema carpocapsae TaxID=34508 RepID=A0A4V6I953_STECR|nr:hypothetical protein L596_006602 [Steinernema carpocapsae]